ncbi:MAG: hypothetical protein ABI615_03700 [Chthoniobacterales bacterium]
MIRLVLTFFCWLFLLDAVLSVAVGLAGAMQRHVRLLDILNGGVAEAAFLVSLVLYIACLFTPRLPKRFIIPATIFLAWANLCLGFPLILWTQGHTILVLSVLQLLLGMGFLWWFHDREKGWFSAFANPAQARPRFTWKNLLFSAGANVVLVPLFLLFWIVGTSVYSIQDRTAGFLTVRPSGVFIQERLFERENQRVHLVGMMHVAESGFYDDILSSLPPSQKSVVLLEGVTDENEIMKGSDLGMRRISKFLGINSQTDSSFTKRARAGLEADPESTENDPIQYVRADRDISDFRPQTIACLREMSVLAASKTWGDFVKHFTDPKSPITREADMQILMDDILAGRNEYILAKIEESASGYDNVVVPWGAMHMPYLEQKLREKGFHEIQRIEHKALAFY